MVDKLISMFLILLLCLKGTNSINCQDGIVHFQWYECITKENDYFAQGRLGTVFLVRDINTNRPYIMKISFQNALTDMELQILKDMVDQPNVIKLITSASNTFYNFYILEYAQQGTLREYGKNNLSAHQVLMVFRDIVSGVASLHSSNYIHLDIRPENILIMNDNTARLADFDRAVRIGYYFNYRVITPYVAPETKPNTHTRAEKNMDIYALGIILYELVYHMKRTPYDNISDLNLIGYFRLIGIFPVYKGMPKEILNLLFKTLAPKPDDRITAKDLLAAVDQTLNNNSYTIIGRDNYYNTLGQELGPVTNDSILFYFKEVFPFLAIILLSYVFMKRFIEIEAKELGTSLGTKIVSEYES